MMKIALDPIHCMLSPRDWYTYRTGLGTTRYLDLHSVFDEMTVQAFRRENNIYRIYIVLTKTDLVTVEMQFDEPKQFVAFLALLLDLLSPGETRDVSRTPNELLHGSI